MAERWGSCVPCEVRCRVGTLGSLVEGDTNVILTPLRTQTQEQRATASKEIRVSKPILHRTTTRRNGCRRIVALEKVAGLSPVGHPLRSSKDEPDMWN